MQAFRSLLYLFGMAVLTLVYGVPCLLTILVRYETRYKLIVSWCAANLWWLRVTCNLRHVVSGKENIPAHPCIVMANHQSTWETMALCSLLPPLAWVVKRELFMIPIFGWGLALTHPIAINRGTGHKAVEQLVKQGKAKLKRGRWIMIFPEGTRTAPGTKRNFKIGGALLAAQSGAPILPIAHNSGNYWARKKLTKKPGIIKIIIGPIIETQGKSPVEINREVFAWISAQRDTLETA